MTHIASQNITNKIEQSYRVTAQLKKIKRLIMMQKNAICLYSQETASDLRSAIRNVKENGYDMMVSCK